MNLADIITLAKQGYKPNDIKELIELANVAPEVPAEVPEVNEAIPEVQPESEKEPEPDYRKMYEDSQKQLKAAQEAATRREVHQVPKQNDDDVIADVVRSFM